MEGKCILIEWSARLQFAACAWFVQTWDLYVRVYKLLLLSPTALKSSKRTSDLPSYFARAALPCSTGSVCACMADAAVSYDQNEALTQACVNDACSSCWSRQRHPLSALCRAIRPACSLKPSCGLQEPCHLRAAECLSERILVSPVVLYSVQTCWFLYASKSANICCGV